MASCNADEEELARRSVELASLAGALDSYFALDAARTLSGPEGETMPLTKEQRRLLSMTAACFEPLLVVERVRAGLADAPDEAWRRTALALLGLHARASDLSLLVQVATDGAGTPRAVLVEPLQEALTAVLRRGGVSTRELDWLVNEATLSTETILRAVGQAGDPLWMPWLTGWLDDAELGARALLEIGRLAGRTRGPLAAEAAARLLPLLSAEDAARRRHALRALAALRAPAAIPHLVEVLDRPASAGEARTAHAALREITGLALPPRAQAWRSRYEEERRWLQERGPAVLELLASDDDAQVVAAIQLLSERFLHRDLLAERIAALLEQHASPAVRGQVCVALARLASETALPRLVTALDDDDEAVRRQAHAALRAITGLELAPDATAWWDCIGR